MKNGYYELLALEVQSTVCLFCMACRAQHGTLNANERTKVQSAFERFFISPMKDGGVQLWQELDALGLGDIEFDDLLPAGVNVKLCRQRR